jgi:homoserine kinase type II
MTVNTQLQEKDIQNIADDYALNVIDFEPLIGGLDNSNFLVQTCQGDYVLTVYEQLTMADAVEFAQLLLMLAEHDYPTTRIVVPVQGELVKIFRGKPVMIKNYIPGNYFRDLNETKLRQVGAAMAQLHQIPVPGFLSQRKPYGILHFSEVAGRNIDLEYESWAGEEFAKFKRTIPHGLPWGLIHSDVFFDNVLFNGDQLIAIIDFMDTIPYFLAYDLGMGMVGLCSKNSALEIDKARALVEGYQNIRELEKKEKKSLQFFAEYAATAVSGWQFWKFHFDTPSTAQADSHLWMKQLAEEIMGIPKTEFIKEIFG